MEVTLLVQAADDSFRLLEDARQQAIELLNSAVKLTSETRSVEERKLHAILPMGLDARSKLQNFAVTFGMLFLFWMILSEKFDAFHLSLGVICTFIISYFSHDLLFANVRVGDIRVIVQRFITYVPWLIYQIVVANFHVAHLALSPRMPIDPQIIQFKTKLESDISFVTLANSITLTPGTITMEIDKNEFVVHALSRKVADDLNTGEMEDRIAHIFMEADHIYIQDVLDVARIFGEMKGAA
jgi:multicomponent Na+:H+ antiporter subunit E